MIKVELKEIKNFNLVKSLSFKFLLNNIGNKKNSKRNNKTILYFIQTILFCFNIIIILYSTIKKKTPTKQRHLLYENFKCKILCYYNM